MNPFDVAGALALFCAIVIGVARGAHKEGLAGLIAFALLFGISFAIIGGLFALFMIATR